MAPCPNRTNRLPAAQSPVRVPAAQGRARPPTLALLLASIPACAVAGADSVGNSTAVGLRGSLPTVTTATAAETQSANSDMPLSSSDSNSNLAALSNSTLSLASAAADGQARAQSVTSWANLGACGIATNILDFTDQGMRTFCHMGLDFWWNWNSVPKRSYSSPCYSNTHVPMIWGIGGLNAQQAATHASRLMGYNEPDLYGPPAYPGGDYLSSGSFAPTFQCGADAIARDWQNIVTIYKRTNPNGVVVSPAMADPSGSASSGAYEACNHAAQVPGNYMAYCPGWLKCFKENVKRLQCGDTNCWDVIDVIQFHAYVYTPEDLINAVMKWEDTWFEDLFGLNGNSKKSLWLTEFARAGAVDSTDPDGKTREFMSKAVKYLKASPHISGWSWFSQDVSTFASFVIGGVVPESSRWSSELINQQGRATVIGEHYESLCRGDI